MTESSAKRPGLLRRFFSALGPGLVTGAADDDPSGVATYSIAGARLGTSLLWTAMLTWPLMAAVQMMCARIGMVTGQGLAGALRKRFPRSVLVIAALALLAANTVNIAADPAGMADAGEMLTGINSHVFVVVFGVGISVAIIRFRYDRIAAVLKWLALVLFAYVIAAIHVGPDWAAVLKDAFIPIPTLAGAGAYAFAETFGWRQGLDQKLWNARYFYGVVVLSTALGIALDFTRINAIQALYWSAVINGLLAPILLVGILVVACDPRVMKGQPSGRLGRMAVGVATLLMFGAAIAMFVL